MESLSWNRGNGHDTVSDYHHQGRDISSYFKWCFVRNPWDRLVSAYEDCPEVFSQIPRFAQFVEVLFSEREKMRRSEISYSSLPKLGGLPVQRIHFFPMILLLKCNDRVEMNFVGRYENLASDWRDLTSKIGKVGDLPHLNARVGKKGRRFSCRNDLYTSKLVEMVGEIYREDAEYFGYQYESETA